MPALLALPVRDPLMAMLAAAVQLATIGPVIPVKGKRPTWADWPARATRTPEGPEWDAATGVGLLTGERAGYFALDVDGPTGVATLAELEAKNGPLPTTWCSHTGGGGAHLYFKHPGFPVRGSAGKLGAGLDVRGEGGQVVAPPSVHPSGGTYTWSKDPWETPLASAPEWLLAMLRPPVRLAPSPRTAPPGDDLRRASAYLARIPPAISGAGGHDTTWKAALAIVVGFDLGEDDAFDLLNSEYNYRCDPPWNEKDLRHKVADAARNSRLQRGYLRDARRELPAKRVTIETAAPTPAEPFFKPLGVLLDKQIPPPEWMVSPWLLKQSLAIVVAPPNAGKTLLACDFALQVAAKGARVAVLEEEGSEGGFQLRMRRSYEAAGAAASLRENVCWRWNSGTSLLNAEHVGALAKAAGGLDLVVLDSLAALTPGMDENDSKEMSAVADTLHRLKSATGATILALHHMTKEAWKPGQKPSLASLRGHGALAARADTAIALVPLEESAGVVRFELYVLKQREAERAPPRKMEVLMTGPAAVVSSTDTTLSPAKTSGIDADVYAKIPLTPEAVSKTYLENVVRGHRAQEIRRSVDRLVDTHRVIVTSNGRYSRPHPTPSRTELDGADDPATSRPSQFFRTGRRSGTAVPDRTGSDDDDKG